MSIGPIGPSSRFTNDYVKLGASLGMNLFAKIPGLATPLAVLPAANAALGSENYGRLLATLAIGAAATIMFGGVNAAGRRELGQAIAIANGDDEATAFWTAVLSAVIILALSALAVGGAIVLISDFTVWVLVGILPLVGAFLNTFDNLRAAYNEHYVTAGLQAVIQTAFVFAFLAFGLPEGSVVVAALALVAPYALASLGTFVLILMERPYLVATAPRFRFRRFVGRATVASLSDGLVPVVVNLELFLLSALNADVVAAWFGTIYRLFNTLVAPLMLVLLPISTFSGLRWWTLSPSRRLRTICLFALAGLGYGVVVSCMMATVGYLYIRGAFTLGAHTTWSDHAMVCVLFLGIIAHKSYGMLILSFDTPRFFAVATTVVTIIALALAVLAMHLLPVLVGIDCFAVFLGSGLIMVLLFDLRRRLSYRFLIHLRGRG